MKFSIISWIILLSVGCNHGYSLCILNLPKRSTKFIISVVNFTCVWSWINIEFYRLFLIPRSPSRWKLCLWKITYFLHKTIFRDQKIFKPKFSLLARIVEHTHCFSTEGKNPAHGCPVYTTKQSDREVPVMFELWGMRSTPLYPLWQFHSGPEW